MRTELLSWGLTVWLYVAIATTCGAQGTWTTLDITMSTPRDAQAALLIGGRVLLVGGRTRPSGATAATTEWFDPAQKSVSSAGEMAGSRSFCPPVLLADGNVLLSGGFRQLEHDTTVRASELYDARRSRWRRVGDLRFPRELHTATELPDRTVLVAGGFSNGGLLDSAELYLPRRRAFVPTGSLHTARFGHTATLLADGLLVSGGRTAKDVSLRSTELYNPRSKTWTYGPTLVQDRFRHTATPLKDGTLLITGGYSSAQGKTLATAERYDPATGLFTLLNSTMSDGRMDHTATLLPDGRVLIAGGWSSTQSRTVASVDIFDPMTNIFTPTTPLPASRHEHGAVLLPDGTVLICGGLQVEPDRQQTLRDLLLYRP